MGSRPRLNELVSSLRTGKPNRAQLDALIGAIADSKRARSMQVLAWLLLEALAPEAQRKLATQVQAAWAPTEGELARLLKLAGGQGLPSLLWLIERSEFATGLLTRLLELTEATGFRVPASAELAKLAVAPIAALRAERRRKLRRSFPVLFEG